MFIRMTLKQFTEAFLESKLSKKDKVELIKDFLNALKHLQCT